MLRQRPGKAAASTHGDGGPDCCLDKCTKITPLNALRFQRADAFFALLRLGARPWSSHCITMWLQFKLNPTPPDPTQQMVFGWMPLIFTFMLAGFPAGLVIYWAWNNLLSVLQQSFIMRRNGVKVELLDNLKSTFMWKKAESKT